MMERKIKLVIEYDGTDFAGWQSQNNARSVQDVIEDAIYKLLKEKIRCYGAGRTDAGVHAKGQTAHFTTISKIPGYKFRDGINAYLPEDIAIVSSEEVPMDFDARRSAVQRWYRYIIYNSKTRPVLSRKYVSFIPYKLDFELIKETLNFLRGEHDFTAFRGVGCTAKRTVLNLETAEMTIDNNNIIFDFKCRSFLYNMVRIMVGALIEIGRGKIPISVIEEMFRTKTRPVNILTASPEGLTLMGVLYPSDFAKKKIK